MWGGGGSDSSTGSPYVCGSPGLNLLHINDVGNKLQRNALGDENE